MRSHVEVQIGMIAKGQADKDAVVAHTLQQFRQKFLFFVAKVARMDALFEASFSPLASSGDDIPLHDIPYYSIPLLSHLFRFNSFCSISICSISFHVMLISDHSANSSNVALPLGSGTFSPEQLPL